MKRHSLGILLLAGMLASLACTSVTGLLPAAATQEPTPEVHPTGASQGVVNPTSNDNLPEAVIVNDEGGPEIINGNVAYTNAFFTTGVAQPLVILEDEAGFVDRNHGFIIPVASQTMGQITSDFETSPFTYTLELPIEPEGDLRDVDNNGQTNTGVMVFAVAYWNNIWDGPFLEERDLGGGGWSTAYASTRVSDDAATRGEIFGGKLVIYAPDGNEGFPSDFGADGKLFTADDPIVRLPQGYTTVDLDSHPFVFDRSKNPQIDLIEPPSAAQSDFSSMSYTDAFNALVDKMSKEYAWTELKHVDFQALHDKYLPQFQAADRAHNSLDYQRALRDFLWEIPDGHINGPFVTEDFRASAGGGLGLNVAETSDHHVFVTYVLPNSPAQQAGIQVGAEVIAINGTPIEQAIDQTTPWLGPFSTEQNRRLDQLLFVVRAAVGANVTMTYQNPGNSSQQQANMTASTELDSLFHALPGGDQSGFELPLDYKLLPNGDAYVQIYSFFDNDLLTVQLWERMIKALNDNSVPGLVIDLRQNGGGRGFLADQMAAYFFNDKLDLGNSAEYDPSIGKFYFDPNTEEHFILPPENMRYNGKIAVLIGPDCASACEFFAYDMTLQSRAAIVGEYHTAGLGGGVDDVKMPDNVTVRITIAQAVDANGNVHIEGKGVQPTIQVPLTEQNLTSTGDPVMDAALNALGQ